MKDVTTAPPVRRTLQQAGNKLQGPTSAKSGDQAVESPAWLQTNEIQTLIQAGKANASLDTEEISSALDDALASLGLEREADSLEDLVLVLGAQGISINEFADDEGGGDWEEQESDREALEAEAEAAAAKVVFSDPVR